MLRFLHRVAFFMESLSTCFSDSPSQTVRRFAVLLVGVGVLSLLASQLHAHEPHARGLRHESKLAVQLLPQLDVDDALQTFSVASTAVFQLIARDQQRVVLTVPKAAAFRTSGPLEPAFMELTMAIVATRARCRNGTAAVVDAVGGNFGQQLALAAVFGCAALAFEPVPRYAAFQRRTLALNDVADSAPRVRLVDALLVADSSLPSSPNMLVPMIDCWTCTGVAGRDVDTLQLLQNNSAAAPLSVKTAGLSTSLPARVESILLARVATLGWEAESLLALLEAPEALLPLNILLTVHSRAHRWPADVLKLIDTSLATGFVGRLIPQHWVRRADVGAMRWDTNATQLFHRTVGASIERAARAARSAARWGNVSMSFVPFQSAADLTSRVGAREDSFLVWLTREHGAASS
jgi:hypothetical protein